jgi:hypothetical protein
MGRKRENTNTAFRTIDQLMAAGGQSPSSTLLRNTVREFVEKMSVLEASGCGDCSWHKYDGRWLKGGYPLYDCVDGFDSSTWSVGADGMLYYYTPDDCSLDESQMNLIEEYCEFGCEDGDCNSCVFHDINYYNVFRVDTWEALEDAANELGTPTVRILYHRLLSKMNYQLAYAAERYRKNHSKSQRPSMSA